VKAVVLVGGEGTRLRPLTETIPKPLLPFMNRPYLDHVLDHLVSHGVDEVILSSSYLEDEFRSFLDARRGTPTVTWITEPQPLGTSGAIAGAADLLDGTFLVLNGDVLTDLDLRDLIRFHRAREAVATIALHGVEDARPFGLVERDGDGRVLAFREKPEEPVAGTINAGTYVLEPRVLDRVSREVPASIERETFPDLIARGEPVFGFLSDAYWRDLGTPEAYLDAHLDALEGLVGGVRYAEPLVAEAAEVAPGSISSRVVVGPGAWVAPGARVDRSVLHEGASVAAGAVVEGSILGRQASVASGAEVRDAVLAEGASVSEGVRLVGGSLRPGAIAAP